MEYFDDIATAIRDNGELPVTAEGAALVIQIIEGAIQSNKEQKVITL